MSFSYKQLLAIIYILLTLNTSWAQECGTKNDTTIPELPTVTLPQELKVKTNSFARLGIQDSLPVLFTIPTVIHVIERSEEYQSISEKEYTDERVKQLLRETNLFFRNQFANDTLVGGADTQIEFCLAKKDPNGNHTTGIIYHDGSVFPDYNTDYYVSDRNEKLIEKDFSWTSNIVGEVKYLNIFVVQNLDVGGWAYINDTKKIFIHVGSDSRVWAHELGHILGLFHTFEDGCEESDCSKDGDRVCDTPPTIMNKSSSRCNPLSPCGFQAQPQNIMDYTGNCSKFFTVGQKARMYKGLYPQANGSTSLLVSKDNLEATGCGSLVPPFAGKIRQEEILCSSDTVKLQIVTTYNNTDEDNIAWTSKNGDLLPESTPINPQFLFHKEGKNNITYTLTNEWGSLPFEIQSPYIVHPNINIVSDTIITPNSAITLTEKSPHLITTWYNDSLGKNVIAKGKEFALPKLGSDTNIYIRNKDTSFYRLIPTPSPEEAWSIDRYPGYEDSIGVEFEVFEPIVLKSLDVKTDVFGFGLKLSDSTGKELAWYPLNLPGQRPGMVYTIPINTYLEPGKYTLTKTINYLGYTDLDIGFQTVNYPLEIPNYIRLNKGINGDMDYLCFFNWRIQHEDFYCESELKKIKIKVDTTLSASSLVKKGSVSIYPNPSEKELNIEGITGMKEISIYDVQGSLILKQNTKSNTLALSHLEKGLYHLQITKNSLKFVFKFVKK